MNRPRSLSVLSRLKSCLPGQTGPARVPDASSTIMRTLALMLGLTLLTAAGGGCSTSTKSMTCKDAWDEYENRAIVGNVFDQLVRSLTGQEPPNVADWIEQQNEEAEANAIASGITTSGFNSVVDQLSQEMVSELEGRLIGIDGLDADSRVHIVVTPVIAPEIDDDHKGSELLYRQLDNSLTGLADRLRKNEEFNYRFDVHTSSFDDSQAILDELADGLYDTTGFRPHAGQLLVLRPKVIMVPMAMPPFTIDLTLRVVVAHPLSNTDIMSQRFEESYCYHPGYERYLTKAENQQIKETGKALD